MHWASGQSHVFASDLKLTLFSLFFAFRRYHSIQTDNGYCSDPDLRFSRGSKEVEVNKESSMDLDEDDSEFSPRMIQNAGRMKKI